ARGLGGGRQPRPFMIAVVVTLCGSGTESDPEPLDGRRTSAYPALAPDVKASGAEFVDGEAVVDGVVVSARAWPDHPAWLRAFIEVLRTKAPLG
ncbi:DJ-1/PfpI family protein, partial [Kitasatospora sp. NPDC096204]|uniref:DJ-1/PfpI family protein n=1 Tax=Kitasatospora sp. NPDC096204 TaxID=3364094 RepID=UPI0038189B1C